MKKKTIAGLIAIAALVAVVIFAGCIETSPYSVEYSWKTAALRVNISGPADDIAVIFTDPEGHTAVRTISKEEMIDNFESIEFYIGYKNPPIGTYKFVVKTITPEKVVYETKREFTPANVRITDAEAKVTSAHFRYGSPSETYYPLDSLSITVKNDGELPIIINNVRITMDGKVSETRYIGYVLHGENKIYVPAGYPSLYFEYPPATAKISLYSEGKEVASSAASVTLK